MHERLQELLGSIPAERAGSEDPVVTGMLREIITLQPRDAAPKAWASARLMLAANLLNSRTSEGVEEAIELGRSAMDVFETEPASAEYARTLAITGSCFIERSFGARRDNIEIAGELIHQALRKIHVLQEEGNGTDLLHDEATCHHCMALVLSYRIDGDVQENLDMAYRSAERAISMYEELGQRLDWANTAAVPGGILARLRGESQAENVERGIDLLEQALAIFPAGSPGAWLGMVHNNVAVAYAERIVGNADFNAFKAAGHARDGLRHVDRQRAPRLWTQLTGALGAALVRTADDDEGRFEAIDRLEEALDVYGPEQDPHRFMLFKRGIGLALASMSDPARAGAALGHLREAWEIATAEANPLRHAELRRIAARAIARGSGEDAPEVREHLAAALSVPGAEGFGPERFEALAALGSSLLAGGDWSGAQVELDAALAVWRESLAEGRLELGHAHSLRRSARAHADLAFALLRLGQLERALLVLDRGKAMVIADLVAESMAGRRSERIRELRRELFREADHLASGDILGRLDELRAVASESDASAIAPEPAGLPDSLRWSLREVRSSSRSSRPRAAPQSSSREVRSWRRACSRCTFPMSTAAGWNGRWSGSRSAPEVGCLTTWPGGIRTSTPPVDDGGARCSRCCATSGTASPNRSTPR